MKLEVIGLHKNYGNVTAINNMSFSLCNGIYGILGPNGSGKSTLMNILTDNMTRTAGRILLDGKEILKNKTEYRRSLGYMPQYQGYYETFTARSFMMYIAQLKGISKKQAAKETEQLLTLVDLENDMDTKLAGFSGGMRQRVMLAQAMLGDPAILILDEPTAGLDPKERINIRNLIAEKSENRMILIATHLINDIECIADEVLMLKKGELIAQGSPSQLIAAVEKKVLQMPFERGDFDKIKKEFPQGKILQTSRGYAVRIASDTVPDGFETADDPSLEDVYMYHFE